MPIEPSRRSPLDQRKKLITHYTRYLAHILTIIGAAQQRKKDRTLTLVYFVRVRKCVLTCGLTVTHFRLSNSAIQRQTIRVDDKNYAAAMHRSMLQRGDDVKLFAGHKSATQSGARFKIIIAIRKLHERMV